MFAVSSKDYWENREKEALKAYQKQEEEYDKEIERIYRDMLDAIQKEIDAFYTKYAKKEGITLAEAKKRVSKLDIEAYERKAKRYVKEAAADRRANGGQTDFTGSYFSEQANEEMALYNLTMKVNRLEMLKANIGLELIKGHNELENFMGEILQGRTMEELERQAGILGRTIKDNAKLAHTIPNASFHNATFSDRIWQYQDLMKADLSKTLQTALIQGKNPRAVASEVRKHLVGDKYGKGARGNIERLMRTELARVQTEAQKKSIEEAGFEMYMFICNEDGRTCEICQKAASKDSGHGKGIYLIKDMMPGTNAAPLHPNCRCSTAPHEDSKDYEEWLEHLEKGGTTEQWNKMKYNKTKKRKMPETTKKISEEATKIIEEIYEKHRLKNNLNVLSIENMGDDADKFFGVNFAAMSKESAWMITETIADLAEAYDTPLQKVRFMTKDEYAFMSKTFAFVSHNYTVDSAELVLNPGRLNDLAKHTERIKELSKKGYCARIKEEYASKYVITHEFAHTILNVVQPVSNKTNYVNADYKKLKKARKEIQAVYEEYMNAVKEATERHKKAEFNAIMGMDADAWQEAAKTAEQLRNVKISDYSLESEDEFFAESFANEKLGIASNQYARRVVDIVDKYYKR